MSIGATTAHPPITLSTAAPTQQLVHIYSANPNKADPPAPIPIDVLYTATGHQVETETTAQIAGTEIGIAFIPVTTSAFVEVVAPPTIQVAPTTAVVEQQVSQQVDTGVAPGQTTSGNERQVLLRIVSPTGDEESAIPVPNRDLNDLPDLFKKLPDGHYRVYLAEGGRQRLVLDVLVRQGRPVDTSEEAATAGDRPPTSQTESDGANGLADAAPQIRNPIPAPGRNPKFRGRTGSAESRGKRSAAVSDCRAGADALESACPQSGSSESRAHAPAPRPRHSSRRRAAVRFFESWFCRGKPKKPITVFRRLGREMGGLDGRRGRRRGHCQRRRSAAVRCADGSA